MGEVIKYNAILPSGWALITFAESCEKISLNGIKIKQKQYLPEGKYPVVDQGQELIGGYFDDEKLIVPSQPPYVVFGDHTRVKKYINFRFIAGADGVKVLKPFAFLNEKLFFYFLHCIKLPDKGYARHLQFLEKADIPIPPLPEQHRIVAKIEELFSSLDKGIESLKTAQQQLKVYRQAVLKWAFEGKLTEEWRKQQKNLIPVEILLKQIQNEKEREAKSNGKKLKFLKPITDTEMTKLPSLPRLWNWVKLGDHAFVTKLAGFEFTKYVKYKHEGDIPVIRAQNVSKDSFIPRNFLYVDREIMEKLPRSRVYGGEILMVFVGAVGNIGIVPEKQEYFLGPNVAKIALEKQFLNKYISHFLSSKWGFANVTGMTKATTQGSISMANIREVSVPLISIEEQHAIVAEIESRLSVCDKIEESIEQSLRESESLRQSILKKAFEGKLVPQDPNDEPASKLLERIRAEKESLKKKK